MTITFFSNYLNHHQLPLCLEFKEYLKDNFKFVATMPITKERLDLGYDDMNNLYDFVVRAYENEQEAYKLALESDVVIFGSAERKYINKRLKTKKLTFFYSERIFKDGFKFKTWLFLIKNYAFLNNNNYLLCASAYCAADYNIAFSFINRCIKWGYFPKNYDYDVQKIIDKKNKSKKTEILWVGRFLDWKHPEKVIEIAKRLKADNYNFSIKLIGTGQMWEEINNQVIREDLSDCVTLTGPVNNLQVREHMQKANIYLFTSDYNEGWGAVLNEAMNSGCAIVASHAIGSVPFLINNNQNGLIYKNDDLEDLYIKVKLIINDKNLQNKYSKNAYETINKYWNVKYAVKEFIKLVNKLNKNKKIPKKNINIPCTKAKCILQGKMYKYLLEKK